jgi:hypothetical protein
MERVCVSPQVKRKNEKVTYREDFGWICKEKDKMKRQFGRTSTGRMAPLIALAAKAAMRSAPKEGGVK